MTTWAEMIEHPDFKWLEYGYDQIASYGGIPPDTYIDCGPGHVIMGLANQVSMHSAYLINRYGFKGAKNPNIHAPYTGIEDITERYATLARLQTMHDGIDKQYDDIIIHGETDNSFWMFWIDCKGTCAVGRFSKSKWPDLTMEAFEDLHVQDLRDTYSTWKQNDESEVAILNRIWGNISLKKYPLID